LIKAGSTVGLRKCKECGNQISSSAKTCPQCGAPVKPKITPLAGAVAFFVIIAICAGVCTGLFNLGDSEWYSGGTLHNATMGDWNQASYANRLATCGDFMATMLQKDGKTISSMDALREEAEALELCITEAGRGGHADTQSVATIAASCYMLMNR
jgi:hypothetical protein